MREKCRRLFSSQPIFVQREPIHPAAPQASLALAPSACGWRAAAGEAEAQAPSLIEAVDAGAALADELLFTRKGEPLPVEAALPARCVVTERLTLPSADPGELDGMIRLQFEKSLPYPLEETSCAFQVLSQTAEPSPQTTLLAIGAHHAALDALCQPLLDRHQTPRRLTLWAAHLAAQTEETACALWREEANLVFAVFENGKVGCLEVLASAGDDLAAALPRALMSAEMAGAPADFKAAYLDPALEALKPALASLLGLPLRELNLRGADPGPLDLTPAPWRDAQARRERVRQWRRGLTLAGAVYAAVLVIGFAWLGIQNARLQSLRKEALALQPQVDGVLDRQTRWKDLSPAIESERYALELLFAAYQSLPSPETRITQFDLARDQFMVEGEAPNAQEAIAVAEKLKSQPALGVYRIESGQPSILPNEHAQFRIFGK